MLADYQDIRKRIKEQPKWFDSNGVPRYDDFHPKLCPNIYAEEVVFYLISCQACEEQFKVEEHWSIMDAVLDKNSRRPSEDIRQWLKWRRESPKGEYGSPLHYGDPPRHGHIGDCAAGDTMNCNDLRILEFWKKNDALEWERVAELEVSFEEAE